MSDKRFPEGFLWGAATASYQVEGGIENTDWAKAARLGRVAPAGRLADHYHRYEADFDLAASLGHTAHRFSVEWARIEPREGEFDAEAIAHYRQMIAALRARGLEPFVTLWHFTLPQWLADKGGFEHPDTPKIFARYCAHVVRELGDDYRHVATINEPNIYSALGYLRGAWPPFVRFSLASVSPKVKSEHRASESTATHTLWAPVRWWRVVNQLIKGHQLAYAAIKAVRPELQVSLVKHIHVYDAIGYNPLSYFSAWIAHYFLNMYVTTHVAPYCDEIGLNFYRHTTFGDATEYARTDMGWTVRPASIELALRYLATFKKPLYVSEAGLADADDDQRPAYIKAQVAGVWRAIQAGADVRAHLYWSLIDNYEWDLGVEKKFGLIAINYDTLERQPRPSAYVYKEIIERNAVLE
jgi:beta-glucosidase